MKAKLIIEFVSIKGIKVTDEMLKKEPKLLKVTQDTLDKIVKAFVEHYKSHNIEVKVKSEVMK